MSFACAGGVLAIAGYSVEECPDYAAEIDAFESCDSVLVVSSDECDRYAFLPVFCVSCDVWHDDFRPMYVCEVVEFS